MKEERHYNLIKSFWDNSSQKVFYSYQRVDLVVIAISTGALATLIASTDKIIKTPCCLKLIYFLAILCFGATIIFNILSQILSAKTHEENKSFSMRKMKIMNETTTLDEYNINPVYGKQLKIYNNLVIVMFISAFVLCSILLGVSIFN